MTAAVGWITVVLLTRHGLIHLLGAAERFGSAEVGGLGGSVGATAAGVRLLAAVLDPGTAVTVAVRAPSGLGRRRPAGRLP